jgi:hypothetical protein
LNRKNRLRSAGALAAAYRLQFNISLSFDEAPDRFLACLPLRKRMSISVPLTRTSSHRR